MHCFPPFKEECTDLEGLLDYVNEKVKRGECLYCENDFGSKDSVKQHMADCGHGKLDIDNFQPF